MKFHFNLSTQTLQITNGEYALTLDENHHFRTLGGIGFALDYPEPPHQPQRWIIFRVYGQKVKVIYKTTSPDGSAIYSKKTIPYPNSGVVEVEF